MSIIIPKKAVISQRIRNGLSVRGLAEKVGVNPATIVRIEKRYSSPNPSTAAKICAALNCDFDELFEIEEAGRKEA